MLLTAQAPGPRSSPDGRALFRFFLGHRNMQFIQLLLGDNARGAFPNGQVHLGDLDLKKRKGK